MGEFGYLCELILLDLRFKVLVGWGHTVPHQAMTTMIHLEGKWKMKKELSLSLDSLEDLEDCDILYIINRNIPSPEVGEITLGGFQHLYASGRWTQ